MPDKERGYSTSQVAEVLDKSISTIRNWTDEFEDFLSTLARIQSGRPRIYNTDDLSVLNLVRQMRDSGFRPEEIYEALQRGERAEMDEDVLTVVADTSDTTALKLAYQLETTQRELMRIENELSLARQELEKMQSVREENIRLQTRLDILLEQSDKQMEQLRHDYEHQLANAEKRHKDQISQAASTYLNVLQQQREELREKDSQIMDLLHQMGEQRERVGRYYARGREEGALRKKTDDEADE